jgi:hypothetical protein
MINKHSIKTRHYVSVIHKTSRLKIVNLYLDYWNNFLTVSRFAEYYNLPEKKANRVINTGRLIFNKNE